VRPAAVLLALLGAPARAEREQDGSRPHDQTAASARYVATSTSLFTAP